MSPEKQRIAIAEACGWVYHEATSESGDVDFWANPTAPTAWSVHDLPDYLNDLNAMHEAEKTLLIGAVEENYKRWDGYLEQLSLFNGMDDAFHSTAKQRAEAFLKTLNLWEEQP